MIVQESGSPNKYGIKIFWFGTSTYLERHEARQLYYDLRRIIEKWDASYQADPADDEGLATEIHEQVHNGASISDVMQLLSHR